MLGVNELIVLDPVTNKEVIAEVAKIDVDTNLVWAKINSSNIVIVNPKDILLRNTPENIKKVLSNG